MFIDIPEIEDEGGFEFAPDTPINLILNTFTVPDFVPKTSGALMLRGFRFANIAVCALEELSNNLGLREEDGWSSNADGTEAHFTHAWPSQSPYNTIGGNVLFITGISQSSETDTVTLFHETRSPDDILLSSMRVGLPTKRHLQDAAQTDPSEWKFDSLYLEISFTGLMPSTRQYGDLAFNTATTHTYMPFVSPNVPQHNPETPAALSRQLYYAGASVLLHNFIGVCNKSFDETRELIWLPHPHPLGIMPNYNLPTEPEDQPNA